MEEVPNLGNVDVAFALGVNHTLRDQIVGLDGGHAVICSIGHKLALLQTDDVQQVQSRSDEDMKFLALPKEVVRVTGHRKLLLTILSSPGTAIASHASVCLSPNSHGC